MTALAKMSQIFNIYKVCGEKSTVQKDTATVEYNNNSKERISLRLCQLVIFNNDLK